MNQPIAGNYYPVSLSYMSNHFILLSHNALDIFHGQQIHKIYEYAKMLGPYKRLCAHDWMTNTDVKDLRLISLCITYEVCSFAPFRLI